MQKRASGSKRVFPNDAALLKLLYLVTKRVTEKWSAPIANWKCAYTQLAILYEDRLEV
ncbi:MAG: transposase [Reichenbachiella sp.]